MSQDEIDMVKVRKCLEAAGLYEQNLDKKSMIEFYNAIKNSQDTANEEDEFRKNRELSKSAVNLMEDSLELEESDNEVEREPETQIDFSSITFDDLPPMTDKLLDVKHHEPKYNLAVDYLSPKYKKMSLKEKVHLLYCYHTNLNKKMAFVARKSIYPAPRPKDIAQSTKFNGSLCRNSSNSAVISEIQNDDEGTYTSRSGRQVKRKKYTEDLQDIDFEGNLSSKKIKSLDEDDWATKKTRTTEKKAAENSKTVNRVEKGKSKASIPEKKDTQNEAKAEGKEAHTENDVTNNEKPQSILQKTRQMRKLSLEETMKRSKLFSPLADKRKTRCELMFDKLVEDEHKKKEEEIQMDVFEQSLPDVELELDVGVKSGIDENMDVDTENVSHNGEESNESTFIRRRIIPPSGRRPIHSRKRTGNNTEAKDREALPVKVNKPTVLNTNSMQFKKIAQKVLKRKDPDNEPSTSKKRDEQPEVNCPLCNELFPADQIEEHAATCGDFNEPEAPTLRSSYKQQISCEICDKVLLFDADYEKHVEECAGNKNRQIN